MRRFIAWGFGYELVWLIDFDGEVNLRLASRTPFGLTAWRMSRLMRVAQVLCVDDGTVRGSRYVVGWSAA